MLLFTARGVVQESLGFSPFELVFGHTVEGPRKLLKEKLLVDDESSVNLFQYISDFHTKLTKAYNLARDNLKSVQNCMKESYDKNSFKQSFQVGDKVLAFVPVLGAPLYARYFGPYVVEEKENELNYVIVTHDRRKIKQLCHVNMLKLHYE